MRARAEEIAWAAGLFEGEGSIVIRSAEQKVRGRNATAVLLLSTTDRDVLERFVTVVGEGHITGPEPRREAHHKLCWRWHVANQEGVIKVLRLLAPFLGERRQARAIQAVEVAWRLIVDGVLRNSEETLFGVRVKAKAFARLGAALGEGRPKGEE